MYRGAARRHIPTHAQGDLSLSLIPLLQAMREEEEVALLLRREQLADADESNAGQLVDGGNSSTRVRPSLHGCLVKDEVSPRAQKYARTLGDRYHLIHTAELI